VYSLLVFFHILLRFFFYRQLHNFDRRDVFCFCFLYPIGLAYVYVVARAVETKNADHQYQYCCSLLLGDLLVSSRH